MPAVASDVVVDVCPSNAVDFHAVKRYFTCTNPYRELRPGGVSVPALVPLIKGCHF